jgi:sugar lactone lactonase YvrE
VPVRDVRVLRDDFMYAEAPRWHDGRLYVSDFYAQEVVAVGLDGSRESVVSVPQQPSGLGWLPDGDLLIASMKDAGVLRFDGASLEPVATLSPATWVNDMVVSAEGRAYVGGMPNFDALLADGRRLVEVEFPRVELHLVEPDGSARVVADGLHSPNGAAITPDGRTLILAESLTQRLLAFDIEPDGSLAGRRVWAELDGYPDGICLDAEGCVWVAFVYPPEAHGFVRVAEGGEVVDRVSTDRAAVAVALGGPDGDDLFMVETAVVALDEPEVHVRGNSRVRVGRTDVPAA